MHTVASEGQTRLSLYMPRAVSNMTEDACEGLGQDTTTATGLGIYLGLGGQGQSLGCCGDEQKPMKDGTERT